MHPSLPSTLLLLSSSFLLTLNFIMKKCSDWTLNVVLNKQSYLVFCNPSKHSNYILLTLHITFVCINLLNKIFLFIGFIWNYLKFLFLMIDYQNTFPGSFSQSLANSSIFWTRLAQPTTFIPASRRTEKSFDRLFSWYTLFHHSE